jgi:hypothetical protein
MPVIRCKFLATKALDMWSFCWNRFLCTESFRVWLDCFQTHDLKYETRLLITLLVNNIHWSLSSATQRNLIEGKLPDAAAWLEMASTMCDSRRRKTIRHRSSLHAEDGVVLLCRNSLRRWRMAAGSAASGARPSQPSGMKNEWWEYAVAVNGKNKEIASRMRSWFPVTTSPQTSASCGCRRVRRRILPSRGQPGGVKWWRGVMQWERTGWIYTTWEGVQRREVNGIGRLGNVYEGHKWRFKCNETGFQCPEWNVH